MTDATPYAQAELLMRALPHMQRYDDATIVVKYGGHAMGDEQMARDFAKDMILLEQAGVNPVVVHGGGPQIGAMLNRLNIKSEFAAGLRVTDKATMDVVEMVLAGLINKQIVGFINNEGGRAIGLCGKDGNMVTAQSSPAQSLMTRQSRNRKLISVSWASRIVWIAAFLMRFLAANSFRYWPPSAMAMTDRPIM